MLLPPILDLAKKRFARSHSSLELFSRDSVGVHLKKICFMLPVFPQEFLKGLRTGARGPLPH
jgi:hypothetical protein